MLSPFLESANQTIGLCSELLALWCYAYWNLRCKVSENFWDVQDIEWGVRSFCINPSRARNFIIIYTLYIGKWIFSFFLNCYFPLDTAENKEKWKIRKNQAFCFHCFHYFHCFSQLSFLIPYFKQGASNPYRRRLTYFFVFFLKNSCQKTCKMRKKILSLQNNFVN